MHELLALEVGERLAELVGVQHQCVGAQPVLSVAEVGSHLAVARQLHDDPDGRAAARAHQPDDVRVVELLHRVCRRDAGRRLTARRRIHAKVSTSEGVTSQLEAAREALTANSRCRNELGATT